LKMTQSFRDQTLSSEAFKTWKSSLTDLGAQFVANKRYSMNAVRLEGCTVTFSRPEKTTSRPNRRTDSDLDARWNSILGVCRDFGFEAQ
jgi:hypothetical protein